MQHSHRCSDFIKMQCTQYFLTEMFCAAVTDYAVLDASVNTFEFMSYVSDLLNVLCLSILHLVLYLIF